VVKKNIKGKNKIIEYKFKILNKIKFRYESKLEDARKSGIKKGIFIGLLLGTLMIVIYGGKS
jgi:hypothetical protein